MDTLDKEILSHLHKAAKTTYTSIADSLGISERTVRNRVKKMLDNGIMKISAVPDLTALGYHFVAIAAIQVRLSDLGAVGKTLGSHPNVCYLANVTGRFDFIAILVMKSAEEYAGFVENVASTTPGVVRTETLVCLNVYKGHGIWPDTQPLIDSFDSQNIRRSSPK